jgi:hypothetical protein
MRRRAFSRQELTILVGIPLAWGILLLFHPGGEGDAIYQDIQDKVTTWMVVHVGMMLFIPLMAVVVFVLLRGLESTAAQISRVAVLVYAVFYGAYETLQGIANGILVEQVNDLQPAERATGSELIQDFAESAFARDFGILSSIGGLAFFVALLGAGMALRREAGAPTSVLVLLGIAGILITAHPPPFGPTGLALFIIAVLLYARSQSVAPAPAGREQAAG